LDGYIHPLNIVGRLPYVTMRPYTDDEWDTLPHVIWSSDNDWDPTVLDHHLDEDEEWYDATYDLTHSFDQRFNDIGDYQRHVVVQDAVIHPTVQEDDCIDQVIYHRLNTLYEIHNSISSLPRHSIQPKPIKYDHLQPYFGWLPLNIIQKTFEVTTQYARMPMSTVLKKQYKSPNPAVNIHHRNEPVATDTVFSDTPAIDGGETMAQIFVGTETLVTDVEGMKSEKQFINALEDNHSTLWCSN
jgi:hypothetical protein